MGLAPAPRMPETSDELALYLHLARASEVRRRPLVRDKLLVLAGKTAVEMHLDPVAEHCRAKVLAHNPGHILRNYPTLAEALDDPAFQALLKRLAQTYPRERAEHMLRQLGIQLAGERHVYADELEYAAALLGTTPERLGQPVGRAGVQRPGAAPPAVAGDTPLELSWTAAAGEPARARGGWRLERQGLLLVLLAGFAATLLTLAGVVWLLSRAG